MAREEVVGFTVVSFESRMAEETKSLIEKNGGRAISAPSMQEIPIDRQDAVFEFAERLFSGDVDVLICLTGVGTTFLIDAMLSRYASSDVLDALSKVLIVARGPKPVRALKKYGLSPAVKAPEPNTWRELLEEIDRVTEINSLRVAVQEYGRTNEELLEGLEARGAVVTRVPVYAWALPDDTAPLLAGIRALLSGTARVAMFTSRTQVDHVFEVAESAGLAAELREALRNRVIASIGPICSEGLREHGIHVDIEPKHPKLGFLVQEIAAKINEGLRG